MSDEPTAVVDHAQVARNLIAMRDQRRSFFPSELFDEHAWVMLLHLFIRETKGDRTSEDELCRLTEISTSVGRRWISHLVQDGQVSIDESRVVALTAPASERMRSFLGCEGLTRIRD